MSSNLKNPVAESCAYATNKYDKPYKGKRPELKCHHCHNVGHSVEKCYHPPSRRLFISRDVKFEESCPYFSNDHHHELTELFPLPSPAPLGMISPPNILPTVAASEFLSSPAASSPVPLDSPTIEANVDFVLAHAAEDDQGTCDVSSNERPVTSINMNTEVEASQPR